MDLLGDGAHRLVGGGEEVFGAFELEVLARVSSSRRMARVTPVHDLLGEGVVAHHHTFRRGSPS
jgi:hypothetical protein